jgi:glycosyltransferase involved in cell wall biosynthesis
MSVGLPVVTTSVGGIPEVVTTQKDGFLIEPQNSQGFAKSLERLLQASELRDQLGAAAHKRVESKFSLKNMVQEYENMYLAKANS